MEYLNGIYISLFISFIIFAIFGFTYAIKQPWKVDSTNLPINDLYKFSAIAITIAIFIFFASFNLLFSLINGYFNFSTDKNVLFQNILNEVKSGILAQRLTSISLGIAFLKTVVKFAKDTPYPNEIKLNKYRVFDSSEDYKVNCESKMNSYEFNFLGITQQAFYVFVLSVLWYLTIRKHNDTYSMLLSYSLFYIVDDWMIVFKHSLILKGNIIKPYNLRIWIFNIVIVTLGILSLSDNYLIMCGFLLLSLSILYYRRRVEIGDLFGQKGIDKVS